MRTKNLFFFEKVPSNPSIFESININIKQEIKKKNDNVTKMQF